LTAAYCGSAIAFGAPPKVQSSTVNVDAVAFSEQWLAAWNAHDVESVLKHFHEDVIFTSPVAAEIVPETAGIVRGKSALRRYWTQALRRIPDLRFVVEGVYQGTDTVVIAYRNQDNMRVSEVLRFTGDVVIEGHAAYLASG
jgi:ketosteroid isomerase-like protein